MDCGEEWVIRPAMKGLCKYESLSDGTLDLGDVARMNAAIETEAENERRYKEAQKQ